MGDRRCHISAAGLLQHPLAERRLMTVAAISRIRPPRWPHPDSVSPTLHRVAKRSFPPKRSAVAEPQSRLTRLTVALLVSLLAHAALMFRLGEPLPLPVSKPEIP
ncbi:MAG: hypothetical protein HC889_07215, partial [Synechococcaceae cyanobacterium SM1_2_3]|nr:hypothetical protein [Synechococcaceae cyanobacterium SM1_2_3]